MVINSPIIVVVWILASLIIGLMGSNRKLGFALMFLISLILSPVIGLIILLASDSKKDKLTKAN